MIPEYGRVTDTWLYRWFRWIPGVVPFLLRRWRKKAIALPWREWSLLHLYEGDWQYYSEGYATNGEYLWAMEVVEERAQQRQVELTNKIADIDDRLEDLNITIWEQEMRDEDG